LNQIKVGNPWIPNLSASFFYSVASTLASESGGSFFCKTKAASEYSGASFLQCPLKEIKFIHDPW
jgi:hypothetical protein